MMGSTGHIAFTPNTLSSVDRIIILRINTDEMQIETLLNEEKMVVENSMRQMSGTSGKMAISLSKLINPEKPKSNISVLNSVQMSAYTVRELENGTIEVLKDNEQVIPAKPVLRELAMQLNISILNSAGNPMNTRQLGSLIIKVVKGKNKQILLRIAHAIYIHAFYTRLPIL